MLTISDKVPSNAPTKYFCAECAEDPLAPDGNRRPMSKTKLGEHSSYHHPRQVMNRMVERLGMKKPPSGKQGESLSSALSVHTDAAVSCAFSGQDGRKCGKEI